jgi:hypothetical protein
MKAIDPDETELQFRNAYGVSLNVRVFDRTLRSESYYI